VHPPVKVMSLEDIIARILSVKPELSREEILKMIERREEDSRGFLTRESAALSLAADLGVPIERVFESKMLIKDLVSGLRNVTVSGRVIYVSPLKKFFHQDGREGFRRSMYIADGSGVIRVVLWDDKAASLDAENLIDEVVRISHASVRRRAGGRLELSAGLKSKIEVNPKDLRDEDYPPIVGFTGKIGELLSDGEVTFIGLIERAYSPTIFKRQNGSEGKVRRVDLSDSTGKIVLLLWDNNADILSEKDEGKYVMVVGAKIRRRFDGKLELHTKGKTRIILLKKKPSGF